MLSGPNRSSICSNPSLAKSLSVQPHDKNGFKKFFDPSKNKKRHAQPDRQMTGNQQLQWFTATENKKAASNSRFAKAGV
jgi:hypothetical protein